MDEPTVDKVQELQDKVEVLERNFGYVKDVLAFEKQRYRDLEREVARFEYNFNYIKGRLVEEQKYSAKLIETLRKVFAQAQKFLDIEIQLGEPTE